MTLLSLSNLDNLYHKCDARLLGGPTRRTLLKFLVKVDAGTEKLGKDIGSVHPQEDLT